MAAARPLDPAAYATVACQGRSALAWEILRRDSEYHAAYRDLQGIPEQGGAADPAFAARWGLHFR
jgi:hypothetical protein